MLFRSEKIDYSKGIYDARQLGTGRMLILGLQHMFAMFGATVLVPLLTGLSVSTTLLCAGLGTLLFHLVTKGKVPAFLGSSFAYLGGFSIVAPMLADADGNLTVVNTKMLPYACAGVALSGILYLLVSLLISTFGIRRIMKFFPPVVTGPIIISIGLILAPSAITNCESNWLLAFVALGTVIVCNIWGKGMVKILPILIGVLVSYAVALVTGAVNFEAIAAADWFGIPLHKSAMGLFAIDGSPEFISAMFTIIPIALATMMEHVGDIAAISATVGHNYINDPGLNRTLMGDGLATAMAGLLGGPANTTYGENTGVLALSRIYDPLVIRIAAVMAVILSFSPKFEAVINTIPTGIIGGISFVLYGMISAIGVRNVVENRVDFTNSRNLIVAAVILVCALGFNSVGGLTFAVGGVSINLSGLAIAAIVGILLNAILPGNDYEFDAANGSGNIKIRNGSRCLSGGRVLRHQPAAVTLQIDQMDQESQEPADRIGPVHALHGAHRLEHGVPPDYPQQTRANEGGDGGIHGVAQTPEGAAGRFHQAADPLEPAECQNPDHTGGDDRVVGRIGGLDVQSQQGRLKDLGQCAQHNAQPCCQGQIDPKDPHGPVGIGSPDALAGEGDGGLVEGVQRGVDEVLNARGGGAACHDHGAEGVDGRLDHHV